MARKPFTASFGPWSRHARTGSGARAPRRDPPRARDRHGGLRRDPHYDVTVCAQRRTSPVSGSGFTINASAGIQALDQAETVIVPGYEDVDGSVSTIALDALLAAHPRRARLVSICTGAFALAATGLLDGRPATTHWRWSDELQTRHPRVKSYFEPPVRRRRRHLTSAGVTTGIDRRLHIIRRDHGAAVANNRARRRRSRQRQGGQAHFVERLRPDSSDDQLAALRDWMLKNVALPLDLDTRSTHPHVSDEDHPSVSRRTGPPPMAWLTDAPDPHGARVVGDDHPTRREHWPPHRTWRSRLCRAPFPGVGASRPRIIVPVPPPHADLDPGRLARAAWPPRRTSPTRRLATPPLQSLMQIRTTLSSGRSLVRAV